MIKKKARKKKVRDGKKAKKSGRKTVRVKQMDMAKVRQDVVNIVGSGARKIAAAVVEEAKKGQLATTKYLFEMAGVFPTSAEAEPEPDSGEESLAKILVDKLKLAEDAKPAADGSVEESGESEEAKDPVIVV